MTRVKSLKLKGDFNSIWGKEEVGYSHRVHRSKKGRRYQRKDSFFKRKLMGYTGKALLPKK